MTLKKKYGPPFLSLIKVIVSKKVKVKKTTMTMVVWTDHPTHHSVYWYLLIYDFRRPPSKRTIKCSPSAVRQMNDTESRYVFFSKVRFRFAPLAIWQSEVIRFVNPNCEISIRSWRDGSGDFNYESLNKNRYRHRVVFGKLICMELDEANFNLRVKVLILKCLVCARLLLFTSWKPPWGEYLWTTNKTIQKRNMVLHFAF